MLKGTYKVKARWYSEADGLGESYVITGDNSFLNTNLEVGKTVYAEFHNIEVAGYGINIQTLLEDVNSLLEDINSMQSVGMDGKKFLVVGTENDSTRLKGEIRKVLGSINAFNNDSD